MASSKAPKAAKATTTPKTGKADAARSDDGSRPDPTKPPSGGQLRHGLTAEQRFAAREQALLDAALDLFGTRGYANTSVRDVCQRAYVSSRDFYACFANREELLRQLNNRLAHKTNDRFTDAYQASRKRTGKGKVLAGLRATIAAVAADPHVLRVGYVETLSVPEVHADLMLPTMRRSAALLARLMDDGFSKARIEPARAEAVCFAVLGAVNQMLTDVVHEGEDIDAEALADHVIDTISLALPIT